MSDLDAHELSQLTQMLRYVIMANLTIRPESKGELAVRRLHIHTLRSLGHTQFLFKLGGGCVADEGPSAASASKPESGTPALPSASPAWAGTPPGFVLCSWEHAKAVISRIQFSIPSATHTEEIQPAEETDCLGGARA